MKIVVCLKEVVDSSLSLDYGLRNGVVFGEGAPLRLNPNDVAALAIALNLKQAGTSSPVEVSLISIGPERVESYLRQGLAAGADRALRIWAEGFPDLSPHQKARLLSRAVSQLGADLVFTGARSLDTGNAQVGPLVAAILGLPCVAGVIRLELASEKKELNLIRDIGVGEREKIGCSLPAVITVKGEGKLSYASVDRLVESQLSEVRLLSLVDLAISAAELKNEPARVTHLLYPRPRARKMPTPDSSLPAFDRILKLLEGGISRRQGLMLQGSSEELADQLFKLLLDEGVLKPAADR